MENKTPSTLASSIGLAFFVSLGGLLLVSILTISLWKSFEWMAIAYALGVLIPAVIAVKIGGGKTKEVIIGGVIAAAVGATTYLWASPQTRGIVLEAVEARIPVSALFLALDDVHDVSVVACQALLRTNYDSLKFRTQDFAARTNVTVKCLGEGLEGTDGDELLRRDVLKLWQGQLLSSNSPLVCEFMEPYATLTSMHQPDEAAAQILSIVTGAQIAEVRECARESFVKRFASPLQQLEGLGNPANLDVTFADGLLTSLTSSTYGENTEPEVKKLTNTSVMRQWGLSLGCALIAQGNDPTNYAQKLNTATRLQSCAAIEGEMAVSVWANACSESLEDSQSGLVTTSTLCNAIRNAAREVSVKMASTIVHAAINAMDQQRLAQDMGAASRSLDRSQFADSFLPSRNMNLEELPSLMGAQMRRDIHDYDRNVKGYSREVMGSAVPQISKGMMEAANEVVLTGKIRGIDVRSKMDVDLDQIFSDDRKKQLQELANDPSLNPSGLITQDEVDMGVESDAMTVEELLGEDFGR